MLSSLRTRLLLTYLLVAGLILAVVGVSVFTFIVSNPFADRLVYQRLETIAATVVVREGTTAADQPRSVERLLTLLGGRLQVRALVVSTEGDVLLDTSPGDAMPSQEELLGLAARTLPVQGRYSDTSGRLWLYVARPLGPRRVLVVSAPRLTVRTVPYALALEGLPGPLLAAAGLGLAVSLALAWLLARWISAPLRRMAGGARRVAAGDYDVQIEPSGPQEVQDVAVAFNHMVDEVRHGQRIQRDFVANVSHELKTPLTSIQGFAQAIKDGTASDAEGREHAAQVIYDEADRLRRLVEALLDLARLESGQSGLARRPVDLSALLTRVADQQDMAAADRSVRIVRRWPAGLPSLVGDGDRLAQVFINLFDNAIRHSPDGGTVDVAAGVDAGWVRVSVADQGPGIAQEDQARIFERFFKVDKARSGGEGRGTGLGLAISREIVSAHGGHIRLDSAPGRGSRFTVELPLSRPDDTTQVRRR
jgi:two-component system OmpR family sensor kinase